MRIINKYKDNSIFELNTLVAERAGLQLFGSQCASLKVYSDSVLVKGGFHGSTEYNWCRKWEDVGDILEDAYIIVNRDSCQAHISSYFNPDVVVSCRNTRYDILRAIVEVWLVYKDKADA